MKYLRNSISLPGLFLLLILIPGANYQVFPGVPISTPFPFLLAGAIAPILLIKQLRQVLDAHWVRLRRGRFVILGIILLAMGAKIGLYAHREAHGLAGYYRSPLAEPPLGKSEMSFENPFYRWQATRIDQQIQFMDRNWNLSFVNSLRFNSYSWIPGNRLRERLPLKITWIGYLQDTGVRKIRLNWTGEGHLQMGDVSCRMDPSYEAPAQQVMEIPSGSCPIRLDYHFDDHSKSGQRHYGPYAKIRVDYFDEFNHPLNPLLTPDLHHCAAADLFSNFTDAVLMLGAVVLFGFYIRILFPAREWIYPIVAVTFTAAWVFKTGHKAPSSILSIAGTCILMTTLIHRHDQWRVWTYGLIFILSIVAIVPRYGRLSVVSIRPGGDDWLTHESFARDILEDYSLRGGEDVFYYQPLFRYIRAAERLLLGDGEVWIDIFALLMGLLGIVLCLQGFYCPGSRMSFGVCSILCFLIFEMTLYFGIPFMGAPASEYPTWVILPWALYVLFSQTTLQGWLLGAFLLGLEGITRVNQLPGILLIFLAFLFHRKMSLKTIGLTVCVLSLPLVLPLMHNLYYGGKWVFFTTSGSIAQNLKMSPHKLLSTLSEESTRSILAEQFRWIIALHKIPGFAAICLHALQVCWLLLGAMGLFFIRTNAIRFWMLWVVPLGYLGVHLIYQVNVYYPRHILIGHLAMGLVTAAVACKLVRS